MNVKEAASLVIFNFMLVESNTHSWQTAGRRVSISDVMEVLCYHLLRRTSPSCTVC